MPKTETYNSPEQPLARALGEALKLLGGDQLVTLVSALYNALERAEAAGYADGRDDYTKGAEFKQACDAYDDGYDSGYADGHADGVDDNAEIMYDTGFEDGLASAGYVEGVEAADDDDTTVKTNAMPEGFSFAILDDEVAHAATALDSTI
jgi:hypothetical protein